MAKFTIATMIEIQSNEMVYLSDPMTVSQYFIGLLEQMGPGELLREHVWTAGLNNRNRILYVDLESVGLSDSSLMSPEGVFRKALIRSVRSIILVHNHPSGILSPSHDDQQITSRLMQASVILGVKIIDHIIVANPGNYDVVRDGNQERPYYSFAEHNLL
jgi:DNA repair protein RadC